MDGFFSAEEISNMSGGRRPPAPRDYALPTQFPSFEKAKRISIDLESYDPSIGEDKGPGWRRNAYIVGVAIAVQGKSGSIDFNEYYPTAHKNVTNLDPEKVLGWLGDNLAFFTGDIVGANLLYDGDGLQYQKVEAPLAKWRDVQWAEALLDENAFSYKLNDLAKKYLGLAKVTDELKLLYGDKYIERFMEVHPAHARKYGLGDVRLPLMVLEEQEKALKKEKLTDLYDLECRLTPFLLYMRRLGVRVDTAKAAGLNITLADKRDECLTAASKICGIQLNAENYTKPTVQEGIFRNLGIKVPRLIKEPGQKESLRYPPGHEKWRPDGKISVTDVWLERLDDDPETAEKAKGIGELLLTANKVEKARGTFVDGYITDNAIGDRVHCEFHPLRKKKDENEKSKGTVSGRFSGSNPNLQNIPARDEEIGPMCRSMFIADEGAQWWSQDYSQIEYRMLIHFAVALGCKGAEVPQELYRKNPDTDFHDMCARMMYAEKDQHGGPGWNVLEAMCKAGTITKDELKKKLKNIRKPAKNLNFGMVYGMGEQKLANSLGETNPDGTPNENAKRIMKQYHEASPYIKDLMSKCTKFAEENEYITTILNRRRRFVLWEPRFTPKGQPRPTGLPLEQAKLEWPDQKLKVSMTHKALNAKLQGSAADLMKIAMVLLWERGVFDSGNDINCTLTVHDELNGSFLDTKRGNESLKEVKYVMENAWKLWTGEELLLPILTGGATGANWSEAK